MSIPIVAMGHLFTAGGQTADGDGVRELYVGSLAHVTAEIFPKAIDYLALGHLHVPQKVGGSEVMRYSGSPLPMGFGEAKQAKNVCLLEFVNGNIRAEASVSLVSVPVFQKLERVKGSWDEISARLLEFSVAESDAWLEVIYEGEEVMSDLQERLNGAVADTKMELLRVKNKRVIDRVLNQAHNEETLDDLNVNHKRGGFVVIGVSIGRVKNRVVIYSHPNMRWPMLIQARF